MYLVYLRFDDQGQVVTMHVQAKQLATAQVIMHRAEQHGLTSTARLVEYALFRAGATIQPRQVPNFHFFLDAEWLPRWDAVEAAKGA